MYQDYFQLTLDGHLEEFCETWPRSGCLSNGIAYQLPPLVLLTAEIGSGLWRTPDVSVVSGGAMNAERRKAQGHAIGLHDQVNTPSMWPTPASRDYRYPNASPYSMRGGGTKGEQLPNAVGGALNPTWVEWLLGFPLGWTALEPSAMQ
jgi:hypothetical protein